MDSMVEDNQDKISMELIKNTTVKFFTVGSKKSGTENKRKTSQKNY